MYEILGLASTCYIAALAIYCKLKGHSWSWSRGFTRGDA